ncbi:Uncharacterized conserved protein, DUF924 family [Cognatiyoonia koreensis]|uniref:Uncharacterized conserved protein, DUF924 family n=1 Tax=Cognatiyoonia koreensis TaxID=364200 RepID=A0A1I0RHQ4_9RHOB|nr:DUF924 family protein [Cognatiyoonia koreensis]SEW40474.1 Uncharacterized conserved protein, DUF924 family [Cognatiyoonia koreensis]
MPDQSDVTAQEIIDFWFPDGPRPEPKAHLDLWAWRMRGGANDEINAKYVDATARAAQGAFDDWAKDPIGRLALIILLDQFSRTVWAGTAKAYAQDQKALALCLEGLENGHFDALDNVWFKSVFKLPMEHCECPDHLANLDRVIAIADQIHEDAPENLKEVYAFAAAQPRKHRAVIAQFGRHSHRNDILGRSSTPEEMVYIANGVFPHETKLEV